MKFPPMPSIDTARLLLRKVAESDLHHYHRRLTSDPEVARYMLWEANQELSHTAAAIARIRSGYASGSRYHWAIASREDSSLMGTIALLRFDEARGSCSFAYMLGREFWGQGYGTEALRAVLAFAFMQMEVSLAEADHFAVNPASGAAMEKAGMGPAGLLPGQYEKNGICYDAVLYQITRSDWLSQQNQLPV